MEIFNTIILLLINVLIKTAPIWVPVVLTAVAFSFWVKYIRKNFINSIKWTLLEIRIPKEIMKSPAAMELALINAFQQSGGVGTWMAKWWLGKVLLWFSLELVSTGGNVKFFVRIPSQFKDIVETNIYAQYPTVEIVPHEVDYVDQIPPFEKNNNWNLWGCNFVLTKDDPLPIKTYIDFGLDKAVGSEEEEKIDPMSSIIETLASMKAGEHMWIQIMIRSVPERYTAPGHWFKKRSWQDLGKEMVKKIIEDNGGKDGTGKALKDYSKLTDGQKDIVKAIERSISKPGFDAGIRVLYLGEGEAFKGMNITTITGLYKSFGIGHLNGFKPTNIPAFDYDWQDYTKNRAFNRKKDLFQAYKLRSYFYPPYDEKNKPFVLNSEELATIYHFPGRVVSAPSFERIDSTKSQPPANLPI
ncbi:MAG: hypothetical protein KBF62_00595 [Candidatus Pacebacteria bacterium]|jgi:hypothetical protein|nr:hypothetical protein [Candidatus Paceibacterota bacterium]MBP9058121.1 hypothetical protein [Candidatus Paceibacterota bacterium]MBP9770103.1 hypothetical protein [Candidatus Paceibacterota bacterium]